jgi:hypothetical protein
MRTNRIDLAATNSKTSPRTAKISRSASSANKEALKLSLPTTNEPKSAPEITVLESPKSEKIQSPKSEGNIGLYRAQSMPRQTRSKSKFIENTNIFNKWIRNANRIF